MAALRHHMRHRRRRIDPLFGENIMPARSHSLSSAVPNRSSDFPTKKAARWAAAMATERQSAKSNYSHDVVADDCWLRDIVSGAIDASSSIRRTTKGMGMASACAARA